MISTRILGFGDKTSEGHQESCGLVDRHTEDHALFVCVSCEPDILACTGHTGRWHFPFKKWLNSFTSDARRKTPQFPSFRGEQKKKKRLSFVCFVFANGRTRARGNNIQGTTTSVQAHAHTAHSLPHSWAKVPKSIPPCIIATVKSR